MKKIYTLCIAALISFTCSQKSNAAIVTVNVEDFQFSPANITINVGDQVIWMWDNSAGQHTTTSTVIPAGAASWDQVISSGSPTFTYTATVPGSYDYICSFHVSMGMVGHITVLGTTGIAAIPSVTSMSLSVTNLVTHELQVTYSIPKTTRLSIQIYDIIGNEVSTFVSESQTTGTYTQTFSVPALRKGIYVINLETPDARLFKKIVIE